MCGETVVRDAGIREAEDGNGGGLTGPGGMYGGGGGRDIFSSRMIMMGGENESI